MHLYWNVFTIIIHRSCLRLFQNCESYIWKASCSYLTITAFFAESWSSAWNRHINFKLNLLVLTLVKKNWKGKLFLNEINSKTRLFMLDMWRISQQGWRGDWFSYLIWYGSINQSTAVFDKFVIFKAWKRQKQCNVEYNLLNSIPTLFPIVH